MLLMSSMLILQLDLWGVKGWEKHCCQIAENSAEKLKYSNRKKLFTVGNWSGTLAEIAEK